MQFPAWPQQMMDMSPAVVGQMSGESHQWRRTQPVRTDWKNLEILVTEEKTLMVVFRYTSMRTQSRETLSLKCREDSWVGYSKLFNGKNKLLGTKENYILEETVEASPLLTGESGTNAYHEYSSSCLWARSVSAPAFCDRLEWFHWFLSLKQINRILSEHHL